MNDVACKISAAYNKCCTFRRSLDMHFVFHTNMGNFLFQVEVLHAGSGKSLFTLNVSFYCTILEFIYLIIYYLSVSIYYFCVEVPLGYLYCLIIDVVTEPL